jgi:hypothetical protein
LIGHSPTALSLKDVGVLLVHYTEEFPAYHFHLQEASAVFSLTLPKEQAAGTTLAYQTDTINPDYL